MLNPNQLTDIILVSVSSINNVIAFKVKVSRILWRQYKSVMMWGGVEKILQNCVTSFMNDP